MLTIDLNKEDSIAVLKLQGGLAEDDFVSVAKVIDPFIEEHGKLNGIIIYTESFSGWESFSALVTHMKFIGEHHKKVSHIAFVTNSFVGEIAQHITGHFVNAQVKTFSFDKLEDAKSWILSAHS